MMWFNTTFPLMRGEHQRGILLHLLTSGLYRELCQRLNRYILIVELPMTGQRLQKIREVWFLEDILFPEQMERAVEIASQVLNLLLGLGMPRKQQNEIHLVLREVLKFPQDQTGSKDSNHGLKTCTK